MKLTSPEWATLFKAEPSRQLKELLGDEECRGDDYALYLIHHLCFECGGTASSAERKEMFQWSLCTAKVEFTVATSKKQLSKEEAWDRMRSTMVKAYV